MHMSGRWVGLGYDDKIMTGWGSMAKTQDEAEAVIARLNEQRGGRRDRAPADPPDLTLMLL